MAAVRRPKPEATRVELIRPTNFPVLHALQYSELRGSGKQNIRIRNTMDWLDEQHGLSRPQAQAARDSPQSLTVGFLFRRPVVHRCMDEDMRVLHRVCVATRKEDYSSVPAPGH